MLINKKQIKAFRKMLLNKLINMHNAYSEKYFYELTHNIIASEYSNIIINNINDL